jgi:hypothetical protein
MNELMQYTYQSQQRVASPADTAAGLEWDGTHLWLNDYRAGKLLRVDPASMAEVDSLACPGVVSGLAWDGQRLWQSRLDESWLQCINPAHHDFDETIPLAGYGRLVDLAWDGRQLWVSGLTLGEEEPGGALLAVNPVDGQITARWPMSLANGGLAFHDGRLWLGYAGPMSYDPASDSFAWTGDERQFGLRQFDPVSGRQVGFVPLPFLPLGLCWAGADLWLVDAKHNQLVRGRLLGPVA